MRSTLHGTGETMIEQIGIGLVGAGGFGEFCLAAFAQMPEVRIAAVADVDPARAEHMAARYHAAPYSNFDQMLADRAVQIVALNTPPYLHAPQGLAALAAGKHLFCEKPLALTVEDGEKLIQTAQANGLRLTVDYVMRHNPYWAAAAALAHSGVLGALCHMDLANHANGLGLASSHWFWDKAQSGGIWIEHGVHFFDAFRWVAGTEGEAVCAHEFRRGDGHVDRVEGLFRYGEAAAHCYHGFDQSGQTEQTTVTLTFERGYVTLREWVPTSLELLTPVDRSAWERHLPGTLEVTLQDDLTFAKAYAPEGKSALYRQSIQAGMHDLINAVHHSSAPLAVTGEDGLASLRIAAAAEQMGRRVALN